MTLTVESIADAQPSGLAELEALAKSTGIAGRRTLAERAYLILHRAILEGLLEPGQRLRGDDLARALGMSPVPIREALRRLDTLGLLEHVPHRGVSVVHLSREDLSDIYAVRLALEPIAVRRAAERFTANDGALAERYLRDHEDAYRRRDVRDVLQTNRDFHFTLYRASGSKWLVRQIELPWDACERYRATVFRAHGVTKLRGPERESHERVLAACVDRDPDRAAEELSRHLSLFSTFVLEQLHE